MEMRALALCAFLCGAAFAWFFVPGAFWDYHDGWTAYAALGFSDSLEYCAAEGMYAPESGALRGQLTLEMPLVGVSTKVVAKFIDAETQDPRKPEIYLADQETTISQPIERVSELRVRLDQRYRAGIESVWGFFVDFRSGTYTSDYSLGDEGWVASPETTRARYISFGVSYGYDSRGGDWDPESGYLFNIEVGGSYLLTDSAEADYVDGTTPAPRLAGFVYIDQFVYTPTSALPVEIPLLTVQAPTVIAVRTSGAYYTHEVPQLISWKASDFELFRGVPHRKLAGYAFFIVAADIRISPIARMYTPVTLLHLLAPRTIPDIRADVEIIPSIDIGKIYGAQPEEQFYTWGIALGLKFSKKLTARFGFAWSPKFDCSTTYFSIRHPF